MAAIPSYRAEMVGLSERDRTLLRSLLAASQARTGIRWDGGATQPPVHFIDIDGQAGAEFWQSLSDDARRDAAIVISTAQPPDATRWLPKPLRSTSLLGVLEKMTLPARPPVAAAQPAAQPAAATPARARNPDEPARLLDILDDAPAPIARAVQAPHWPDLVLASGHSHVMRTAPMEAYVEGFAASTEVSRVAKYAGGPLDDELRTDLDTLRWLVMLHAPLGEIARRLPRPARVRLRTLPAFGHLPHTLPQVRMAAWLTQHSASPQDLAEMVGANEETVLRFLGACDAIGLMQEVSEVAAPVPASAPVNVVVSAPAPTPAPVAAAAIETPAISVEAPAPAAPEPSAPSAAEPVSEGMSVLERLRASREQNRARVAAIRGTTTS
jgi:hypothetical protein